jgi:alkanesulfonate monooxygenase SsuD/methylene tetrahydromethanopterin reductase-like flavin-dependent oxidoreductase (luciferase family)
MAEAVEIMHRIWSGSDVTYRGRIHSVQKLTMSPRPAHAIPIWLGTYGPRALAATGRLADWIPSLGFAAPSAIPAMLDRIRIRTAAAEAGRAPEAVRAIYNVSVEVDRRAARASDTITGSAADFIEQLRCSPPSASPGSTWRLHLASSRSWPRTSCLHCAEPTLCARSALAQL